VRFIGLTALFVVLYYWASSSFLRSDWLLRLAHWATALGGWVMESVGVQAEIRGNYIVTPYGRYIVTQACVATPLVAVYLAAVLTAALSPLRKVLAVLATVPLFVLLGSARILVLALPRAAVGSHEVAIHAFYQLIAAVVVVTVLAKRRGGMGKATVALAVGAIAGLATGWISSLWMPRLIDSTRGEVAATFIDPQGALSILPAYQVGLWVALVWVLVPRHRAKPLLGGVLALTAIQVALAVGLAWVASEAGETLPPVAIRMIALLATLGLAALMLRSRSGDSSAATEDALYRDFWEDVGDTFPDLGEAESTRMYREDEQRLFNDYLSPLDGQKVFKTDLWDEAKNTRILRWAAAQGCRAYGIDISPPIAAAAETEFALEDLALQGSVSDVRAIPFRDGSFDAVYSMGTVEHFDETQQALEEIYRVLRPGGRGVIGVPNRRDPFLRPLFVALMDRLGLYGYGFEKSYSRPTFRRMLEEAGFEVIEETAILFIPGWLRMAELALHSWARPFAVLTLPFVRLFRYLSRRFPVLQRHGYLLATAVRRPD
jgi:SAM-dependent methyltransferase